MTIDELIGRIEASIATYRAELPVVVSPGGDIQAALNNSINVELVAGGVYTGRVTIPSGRTLRGNGARLQYTGTENVPVVYVAPGTTDVVIEDLICLSAGRIVVQLGDNYASTQSTLDSVPRRITLRNVTVPSHRWKCGFEVNAAEVVLEDCNTTDIYDPLRRSDSQGVAVLNTPGPVTIRGGRYEAGSECILFGGDDVKIPGVTPSDILIENVAIERPLSWQTDGINRDVKTSLEFKTGHRVVVRNCVIDGCWVASQSGYGITITPRNDGSIVGARFENVTVRNVASVFNVMGVNNTTVTPFRTTGIVIEGGNYSTNPTFGTSGRFVTFTSGPGTFVANGFTSTTHGTSFAYHSGPIMEELRFTNATFNTGAYGINLAGGANLTLASNGAAVWEVANNTISGATSTFRTRAPQNTYL